MQGKRILFTIHNFKFKYVRQKESTWETFPYTETAREPVRYVRKFMFYNRQLTGKWPWTPKNLASAKAEMISTSWSSFFSKTCWCFMTALPRILEDVRFLSFPFLSFFFFFFFAFRLFVFFFVTYEIILTSNQIDCITLNRCSFFVLYLWNI